MAEGVQCWHDRPDYVYQNVPATLVPGTFFQGARNTIPQGQDIRFSSTDSRPVVVHIFCDDSSIAGWADSLATNGWRQVIKRSPQPEWPAIVRGMMRVRGSHSNRRMLIPLRGGATVAGRRRAELGGPGRAHGPPDDDVEPAARGRLPWAHHRAAGHHGRHQLVRHPRVASPCMLF